MALHQNIADIQRNHAFVLLDQLVDLHHSVAWQIEGIVAAHETAAGTDFELDEVEMLLFQESVQCLHVVGREGLNLTGRAEAVGILLEKFLVIDILEAVHAAVHQNSSLYVVAVHDRQGLLRCEAILAIIAGLREKLEYFAASPLAFAAADGAQLTASAVTRYDLGQM